MARSVRIGRRRISHDEVNNTPVILYSTDRLLLLMEELMSCCLAMEHSLGQLLPISELLVSFITSLTKIAVVDAGDHSAEFRISTSRGIISYGFWKLAQKYVVQHLFCFISSPPSHRLSSLKPPGKLGWIGGHRFVSRDGGLK